MTSPLDLAEKVREACAERASREVPGGGLLARAAILMTNLAPIVAEWERGHEERMCEACGQPTMSLGPRCYPCAQGPAEARSRPRTYTEAEVMEMLERAADDGWGLGGICSPATIASRILAAKDGGR